MMNHIGLFEGIGGFSVAAKEMGWNTIAWCEIDPFCQTVLKDLLPNATPHANIKTTDFRIYRGQCEILTGGFPCQPYSLAGKRLGTADERHLWPSMLRAIREIRPTWIVGENVYGIVSWNRGLVFEEVCAALEAEGYEVQPVILPACGVDAPHKRDRVWFVAKNTNCTNNGRTQASGNKSKYRNTGSTSKIHSAVTSNTTGHRRNGNGKGVEIKEGLQQRPESGGELERGFEGLCNTGNAADTNYYHCGCGYEFDEELGKYGCPNCEGEYEAELVANSSGSGCKEQYTSTKPEGQRHGAWLAADYWANFPTQSPICNGNDGFPAQALRQRIREDCMGNISEKEIDQIISQAANRWRNETIKAGGNAVVPQVVFQIYQAIEKYEKLFPMMGHGKPCNELKINT